MNKGLIWFLIIILVVPLTACTVPEEAEAPPAPIVTPEAPAEELLEEAEDPAVEEAPAVAEIGVPNVIRATDLLGYDVIGGEGADLGDAEDVMLLPDGEIDYVVMSFGAFLGLGGRLFLIPWEAVTVVPEGRALAVEMTQETLDNAPAFAADAWPETALPDWDAEVIAYWQSTGVVIERAPASVTTPEMTATPPLEATPEVTETVEMTGTPAVEATLVVTATPEVTETIEVAATPEVTETLEITATPGVTETPEMTGTPAVEATLVVTATPEVTETIEVTATPEVTETLEITATPAGELQLQIPRSLRLSVLLDYTVRNPAGENLGELEDLMINWREGRAAYTVLSFGGGFLGLGEKWFAIPLNALIVNPVDQTVVIDIERELLEVAPGFDRDNWPETASPDWDAEIRQYWEEYQRQLQEALTPPALEVPGEEGIPPEEDATPTPAP